eukprot:TRINITY_DN121500_c0_g1_i1.p1 TRINITY_DN121500_c0_g1~~TRINITY_DN121500_c0_g1_i1.p1  ORF type:complete len:477 (+),score=119.17 TRINITY_DN121500_c0_g1_i1:127-1557(+)
MNATASSGFSVKRGGRQHGKDGTASPTSTAMNLTMAGGELVSPRTQTHAAAFAQPRMPPEKTVGEFSELAPNYGSYRPARMGLRAMLDSGKMRNPLEMQQSAAPWSARRPLSASSTGSRPGGSRPTSAVRIREKQSNNVPMGGGMPPGADRGHEKGSMAMQPQRIELPGYLNTPARRPDWKPVMPEDRTQSMRRMQDLELLTFACRRANKLREEGRAHFSMGVLRDNIGQFQKAIESYNSFLKICKDCNDGQGCALAYHCIAVDYQLIGSGQLPTQQASGSAGASSGDPAGEKASSPAVKPDILRKAIFYHNKHRENTDAVGKFVAHLNMGLAYSLLGEKEASTVNHQYALRYAMQLHSLEGQSLAIGSLSFSAGMYDNDPEKMRNLIERYIDLCATLKQQKNQVSAYKMLGNIAAQQGESEQSIDFFKRAVDAAKSQGDLEAQKECAVRLGIATGQAKMAEHLSGILQRAVVNGV